MFKFLENVVEKVTAQKRELQVLKSLLYAENLQVLLRLTCVTKNVISDTSRIFTTCFADERTANVLPENKDKYY